MDRDHKLRKENESARKTAAARERIVRFLPDSGSRWLLVDVDEQHLFLFENNREIGRWPVSTAAAGIDGAADSGGTPPGVHVVREKIGEGAEPGAVFRSREATGERWPDGMAGDANGDEADSGDLILTRILTLDGCEEGVNRGPGCDSRERYIYIHGTNHESALGRPVSHGCVRMAGAAVAELFDLVREGDPVVVV